MKSELERIGYEVDHSFYSPQDFGIPQNRKRIFIVGSKHGLKHFDFSKIVTHHFEKTKNNKQNLLENQIFVLTL